MKPLDPAVNSMLDRPKTIKSTNMWSYHPKPDQCCELKMVQIDVNTDETLP